jgi:hypothetical protein
MAILDGAPCFVGVVFLKKMRHGEYHDRHYYTLEEVVESAIHYY